MEFLSKIVRVHIPDYLNSVPVPDSFGGFLDLTAGQWLHLFAFSGTVAAAVYMSVKPYLDKKDQKDQLVNLRIQKESSKVVNMVDIEDLGNKVCYCRCWRSKKFPLCDGSHAKHNEDTGDNVGPLVLKRKDV
uniref:CDGSH iron-sulfur domain-containing protein 2 homolog A n=1 Tax=Branchiostoma floridae TaxID=7739 RepID=CID2A_BRAFL|nr:RecName: Full=CDGSH iron-sulfur domain-containing protein 2 homolog A [Branchiostoma floridae]|eukprot:XP_002587097.1 hypothetical protein BRAFLDRAFT_285975 [Branchiostoma floridae]